MALHDLCRPCAVELARIKPVTFKAGGVNRKGTCWICGRRRYVATYNVPRRKPKGGDPV